MLNELVNNHSTVKINENIREFCAIGVSGSTLTRKSFEEAELPPVPREVSMTMAEQFICIALELEHDFGEETLFIRQTVETLAVKCFERK